MLALVLHPYSWAYFFHAWTSQYIIRLWFLDLSNKNYFQNQVALGRDKKSIGSITIRM
jgi:hypothetical protein